MLTWDTGLDLTTCNESSNVCFICQHNPGHADHSTLHMSLIYNYIFIYFKIYIYILCFSWSDKRSKATWMIGFQGSTISLMKMITTSSQDPSPSCLPSVSIPFHPEALFEKSHLKCKPNHWFGKGTPTCYDWNEVGQTSDNYSDKVIHF